MVRGLLAAEIRRFSSRRLVLLLLGLTLLSIVLAGVIVAIRSHRPPSSGLGRTAARSQELQACLEGDFGPPEDQEEPGFDREEFCREVVLGGVFDPRFHL